MRYSKNIKTKNWVFSVFKGIAAGFVILMIIAMLTEKEYVKTGTEGVPKEAEGGRSRP